MRLDYFTGASDRWRTEAKIRARQVIGDHADDPMGYVDRRLGIARFGSFEQRRWRYIRTLIAAHREAEARRLAPPSRKR
ncbi:hypothetical protein [Sphingomonas sp. TZW2008]|uniref:hypothetical protein n=1 Tax=Sphingomonas sp. TZW2008 TaxID=1917973 RepID=UPI000A269C17|nr:hypothetical protein [Sphingomonas sp. TZW2008]